MYYIAELSMNPSDSMQYSNALFSAAHYMIFLSLQVHFSSGGVKLLALAEALLKKHINSHSLHEPEGISDFLMPFAILVILLFFHTLMWFFPDMCGLCGSTFSLCFNFGATGKI